MKSFSDYTDKLRAATDAVDVASFDKAIGLLRDAWRAGRRVYVFGNGGSALTASHMVTDLSKMLFLRTGRMFDGVCLNDNMGLITAYANDLSYDDVFAAQIEAMAKPEDLVIAISGSGNSPNVVKAVEAANKLGATTLALCGYDGGRLKEIAGHSAHVPVNDMQLSEDLHLVFVHAALQILAPID
jgi:D-sedoheptulose 7-phosphate isomerase